MRHTTRAIIIGITAFAVLTGLGLAIGKLKQEINKPAKAITAINPITTTTTSTSTTIPITTTTNNEDNQTCIDALDDASKMFDQANVVIGQAAELFTMINEGDFDIESQVNLMESSTQQAVDLTSVASESIGNCISSNASEACINAAHNAKNTSELYAHAFSAIKDSIVAVSNFDTEGLNQASSEIQYVTTPLATAYAVFIKTSADCTLIS